MISEAHFYSCGKQGQPDFHLKAKSDPVSFNLILFEIVNL